MNPSNGYVNEAEWGVYDSKVASVDQKGLVSAVGIGDTRVWLRVQPSNHIAHFHLHVVQNPVPLNSPTLSPSSLDLGVGSSGDFEIGFYPENTTQRDLVWESSDKSVAVVGADGKITGKGPGTATITVTEQNSNKKASANVTVAVPFSSITLDFPSARFLQVEERSGKSCFAIEKGITYNTSVTTKPSNSTDRLVYTVESGKESFLTVDDEGHMTGYKYGGPVTVTISSRLNDKLSTSFNVFIYDNPTGVKLDGRNVEGIGSGCSQSWYMVPVPATAYPYDSFELLEADDNLSASVRGNSLVVAADKLGDASLSTPSSIKFRTVTVKYGSYPATLRFMLCKYDPFQCKIGDGLVYHDNALCCYDGGYRGLGVIEESAFVDNNDPPFGIIAFIGDEQLRDPFLQHTTKKMTLTSFGVTKCCIDGSTVAKLPAKVQHDIKVGLVSVGHAKVLLGVEDPKTQELLCNLVINNGISVRQLEEKVRLLDKQKPAKQKASSELPDEYYRVLEHMGKFFENSISLKRSDSGKGTMTIRFSSDEEIRKFLQALEDKNI